MRTWKTTGQQLDEELLACRTDIKLKRPSGTLLVRELPIGVRNVVGIEQRFGLRIGDDSGLSDDAVDYDMRDMNTLRPKLARE